MRQIILRYPGILKRRKEIIEKYNKAFKGLDIEVLDHYGENHTSSGHLYLTRLIGKSREECNDVIVKMAEAEIATNVHYKPLPMMTAYRNLGFDIQDFPNAYHMFENEITLPHDNLVARVEAAHEREEYSLRTSRCNDDIIGSYVDVEFLIVIYKLLAIAEIALTWRILQDRAVYMLQGI